MSVCNIAIAIDLAWSITPKSHCNVSHCKLRGYAYAKAECVKIRVYFSETNTSRIYKIKKLKINM